MNEIPEHLLKRAQQARDQIGTELADEIENSFASRLTDSILRTNDVVPRNADDEVRKLLPLLEMLSKIPTENIRRNAVLAASTAAKMEAILTRLSDEHLKSQIRPLLAKIRANAGPVVAEATDDDVSDGEVAAVQFYTSTFSAIVSALLLRLAHRYDSRIPVLPIRAMIPLWTVLKSLTSSRTEAEWRAATAKLMVSVRPLRAEIRKIRELWR